METLPLLGRSISDILEKTVQIYGNLLAKHAEAIHAVARETYSYGSHERQQLDLYTPSLSAPKPRNGKITPVLIFTYGGGFVSGDKVLAQIPEGLVYTNVGYYFAERFGFETIIPDYRLVQHGGHFPSGGEDLDLVLAWARERYSGQTGKKIFLMGNSAGGVHVTTWLLAEQFQANRKQLIESSNGVALAGIILLGAPLHFNSEDSRLNGLLKQYFGEDYRDKTSLALLKKAIRRGELKGNWPHTLVLHSELDPGEIIESNVDFFTELRKARADATHWTIQGHNHISPPIALGTGIDVEEKWGRDVGIWAQNI